MKKHSAVSQNVFTAKGAKDAKKEQGLLRINADERGSKKVQEDHFEFCKSVASMFIRSENIFT